MERRSSATGMNPFAAAACSRHPITDMITKVTALDDLVGSSTSIRSRSTSSAVTPPTRSASGVRRPGRRPGAHRRRPHGRRIGPVHSLHAYFLRPGDPTRPRSSTRSTGSATGAASHPAGRRHPARRGDLQPAGELPRLRAGTGSPADDAVGHAPTRSPCPTGTTAVAVPRPARRPVRPPATDRPALHRRRPDEAQGDAGSWPTGVAARRRQAPRRPGPPRLHRHLRQRHDAARHGGDAVRAGLGLAGG